MVAERYWKFGLNTTKDIEQCDVDSLRQFFNNHIVSSNNVACNVVAHPSTSFFLFFSSLLLVSLLPTHGKVYFPLSYQTEEGCVGFIFWGRMVWNWYNLRWYTREAFLWGLPCLFPVFSPAAPWPCWPLGSFLVLSSCPIPCSAL